jgi:hypothetical protein
MIGSASQPKRQRSRRLRRNLHQSLRHHLRLLRLQIHCHRNHKEDYMKIILIILAAILVVVGLAWLAEKILAEK